MSENSKKNSEADSSIVNTKWVLLVLVVLGLIVVGFYYFNFNSHLLKKEIWQNVFQNLSENNDKWGTFGDYVGGILNPIIAAFAFYLIAKTYELQKTELKETRSLLEVSTNAQKEQIKLAALSALLNSFLMRIDILNSEKFSLLQGVPLEPQKPDGGSALPTNQLGEALKNMRFQYNWMNENTGTPEGRRFVQITKEIKTLNQKTIELEEKIESFSQIKSS